MLSQAQEKNMAKLTDTQLIVLSKVARREDGAADVPERMNKAAAAKVGASLVVRRLMREIRAKTSSATVTAVNPPAACLPRSGSKQALIVAMLTKDKGATLAALVEATGWLPHTTRAAMTGLRKRGFAIERTREEGSDQIYWMGFPRHATAA